jgi:hypothetical protein
MAQRMNFKNGRAHGAPVRRDTNQRIFSGAVRWYDRRPHQEESAILLRRLRSAGLPATQAKQSRPNRSHAGEFARDQLSDPGENAPIKRTNDAQATLGKIDWNANSKNFVTFRYNFSNSRQNNGTFDVDPYGASANAIEKDHSNTVNGSVNTTISAAMLNEFRIQFSREDRPRDYSGPTPDIQGSAIRCDIMPLCG